MEQIEYLEEERKKLWAEVDKLRDGVKTLAEMPVFLGKDDEESSIRRLGIKASRAYNAIQKKKQELDEQYKVITKASSEAAAAVAEITAQQEHSKLISGNFAHDCEDVGALLDAIKVHRQNIDEVSSDLATKIEKLSEKHQQLLNREESLNELINSVENLKTQTDTAYSEISGAYKAIFGYTDSSGVKVEGKKHVLDAAYEQLIANVTKAKQDILSFEEDVESRNNSFLSAAKTETTAIVEQLKARLPDCLTAGLSAAYQKAREKEEDSQRYGLIWFGVVVLLMVVIAAVPAAAGIWLRLKCDYDMVMILNTLPKIAWAIVPLYFPLLWAAVFLNRRVNLSKRLIEEYKHKEVVSKTYEGLSTQIETLEDEKVSTELLARLLYNTVRLSEKNPGELIKNYSRPDNPIVDVIDHGAKLSGLIDKVAQIPGIEKLFHVVEKRRAAIDKAAQGVVLAASSGEKIDP